MNKILKTSLKLLFVVSLVVLFASNADAAAPTGASAVMNNTTATTVDVVITGTDFVKFVSAQGATANATDLAKITYQGVNPTSATIDNITTITATFAVSMGTDKSGSLTLDAGTVEDAGAAPNLLITIVDGTITDSASPIISTVTIEDTDHDGLIDKITYTWSEDVDTDDSVPPVAADLPVTLLSDGETAVFTAAAITDPAGAAATVVVTGITGQLVENTAAGSTAISGDLSALWEDVATVPVAADAVVSTAGESIVDSATPIVLTVEPATGSTGVDKNAHLIMNFSEAMDTTSLLSYTTTPLVSEDAFTDTWSNSNKTLRLTHTVSFLSSTVYTGTLTTIDDVATPPNSLASAFSWTFTTKASEGSGSSKKKTTTTTTTTQTQNQGAMVGGLNIEEIFSLQEAGFTASEINLIFGLGTQTQTQAQTGAVSATRPGTNGTGTSAWQTALQNAGFDPGPIDGLWGPKTEAAVRAFQAAHGLAVDGRPGPLTTAAMNGL